MKANDICRLDNHLFNLGNAILGESISNSEDYQFSSNNCTDLLHSAASIMKVKTNFTRFDESDPYAMCPEPDFSLEEKIVEDYTLRKTKFIYVWAAYEVTTRYIEPPPTGINNFDKPVHRACSFIKTYFKTEAQLPGFENFYKDLLWHCKKPNLHNYIAENMRVESEYGKNAFGLYIGTQLRDRISHGRFGINFNDTNKFQEIKYSMCIFVLLTRMLLFSIQTFYLLKYLNSRKVIAYRSSITGEVRKLSASKIFRNLHIKKFNAAIN